ncbi:hypothetical protein Q8W37_12600 [Shimia thalassica]|uniref:hypothetical protein n=1 Tax=Shimia thalassica TaxID=1715693 RepID=UPI0027342265|nr:hypothetical protein [Shimia thalassica]MDP2580773.1 hypothetical protein [Shimia thalassica]
MIEPNDIRKRNAALCLLAQEKFSVKPKSLSSAMRKIGRRLPKRAHESAKILAEAEAQAGHPKLAMMMDQKKIDKAERELKLALEAIDPADRRKGMVLSILGSVAFSLIVVFAALMIVLRWRGFV